MASEEVATLAGLVGEWRVVQKLMFIFVQFSYVMFGWQSTTLVFLIPDVKMHCEDNNLNSTNITVCSSECSSIQYEHDEFKATLTEKFGLVCGRSWLQSLCYTLLMVGSMVGNLLAGELADRIGRRRTVMLSMVPYLLGSLLMVFPLNYSMFAVGVVLVGMAYVTLASFSYVLFYELCGESKRDVLGVSLEFGFSIGTILTGVLAWALRDWFHLQIINTCLVFLLALSGFLPESTEWLMKNGRDEEAFRNVKKIIRVNRKPNLSDSELQSAVKQISKVYKDEMSKEEKSSSMVTLISLPEYRFKTLCICYFWFATTFVSYGVTWNVNVFGENLFMNYITSSALTLPSIVIILVLLRFLKINWVLNSCNTLIALIAYLYIVGRASPAYKTASTVLLWNLVSPVCIMLYPYTVQLYPTEVRGKAVGIGTFMANIGGAVAPFVKELAASTQEYVPMMLFGALFTVQVLLMFKLGLGNKKSNKFDLSNLEQKKAHGTSNGVILVCASNTCHRY